VSPGIETVEIRTQTDGNPLILIPPPYKTSTIPNFLLACLLQVHLKTTRTLPVMDAADTSHSAVLTGEVIETFEREGKQIAKISLRTCHIEVPMDLVDAAHLGDTVRLSVVVAVDRMGNPDQYS